MTGPDLPQSIRLSFSGELAELTRDTLTESGVVLSIGGAEQSHVEAKDPHFLLHDYIRRMRAVLTNRVLTNRVPTGTGLAHAAPDAVPTSAVHFGAGAMTLPRWMQHRWPHIAQTVLDIEPELVDFVLEHLPLQPQPENIVADAAEAVAPGGALQGRRFDVVVLDLYNSAEAPVTLTAAEFFHQVLQLLAPQGILLMNFGDEADMRFARTLVGRLMQALQSHGLTTRHALLSAPDAVLGGAAEGNLMFAAVQGDPFADAELARIWAAGPHPGELLSGEDLQRWSS